MGVFSVFLVVFFGVWLSHCQKSTRPVEAQWPEESLWYTRWSSDMPHQAIILFKEPSLLDQARWDGKTWKLPQDAIEKIERVQNQWMSRIKKLAPNTFIVARYRVLINGFGIVGPLKEILRLNQEKAYLRVFQGSFFKMPPKIGSSKFSQQSPLWDSIRNHLSFMKAPALWQQNLTGKGQTIAIIDSGVDYTHVGLGGSGHCLYESIQPDAPAACDFPNAKVVGGYDFVGSQYDPISFQLGKLLPRPDDNPLDENGHGTHVAYLAAGLPVGGISSPAPDAKVMAFKIFSGGGSTSDLMVVAALERSVDPNGDGLWDDRVDVINLSLGGAFGPQTDLLNQVIRKIVDQLGIPVVAAAGNSGPSPYSIANPANDPSVIAVGAVIDDSPAAIQRDLLMFSKDSLKVSVVASKNIYSIDANFNQVPVLIRSRQEVMNSSSTELKDLAGSFIVIAEDDLNYLQKLEIVTRLRFARALGVLFRDRSEFEPEVDFLTRLPIYVVYGSESLKLSKILFLRQGITLTTRDDMKIEDARLISVVTAFSARGPGPENLGVKPDVLAPGYSVVSATIGSKNDFHAQSGTSMASPLVAGVIASLKQRWSHLNPYQIKALLMNTAFRDPNKHQDILATGAGIIQADRALGAPGFVLPSHLDLGFVKPGQHLSVKMQYHSLQGALSGNLQVSGWSSCPNIKIPSFYLNANQIPGEFSVSMIINESRLMMCQGEVIIQTQGYQWRVPYVLKVVPDPVGQVKVVGGDHYHVRNDGNRSIWISYFDKLWEKSPEKNSSQQNCNIKAVGARKLESPSGSWKLQILVQFHKPFSNVNLCELTSLWDLDEDGVDDWELAQVFESFYIGIEFPENQQTASVLFNVQQLKIIREQQEKKGTSQALNLRPAVLSVLPGRYRVGEDAIILELDGALLKGFTKPKVRFLVQKHGFSANQADVWSDPIEMDLNYLTVVDSSKEFIHLEPQKVFELRSSKPLIIWQPLSD